jgi:hypothetical protein
MINEQKGVSTEGELCNSSKKRRMGSYCVGGKEQQTGAQVDIGWPCGERKERLVWLNKPLSLMRKEKIKHIEYTDI